MTKKKLEALKATLLPKKAPKLSKTAKKTAEMYRLLLHKAPPAKKPRALSRPRLYSRPRPLGYARPSFYSRPRFYSRPFPRY
jgi:hypothetical protein